VESGGGVVRTSDASIASMSRISRLRRTERMSSGRLASSEAALCGPPGWIA